MKRCSLRTCLFSILSLRRSPQTTSSHNAPLSQPCKSSIHPLPLLSPMTLVETTTASVKVLRHHTISKVVKVYRQEERAKNVGGMAGTTDEPSLWALTLRHPRWSSEGRTTDIKVISGIGVVMNRQLLNFTTGSYKKHINDYIKLIKTSSRKQSHTEDNLYKQNYNS